MRDSWFIVLAIGLAGGGFEFLAGAATDVVNVRDYGAKGDGKSDDTAAVVAATAAQQSGVTGAYLYFPKGTYLFSVPFNTTNALHLEGAGFAPESGSVLEFTGDNQPIIQINGRDNDLENVLIKYQHFQKPGTDPKSACIQFNNGAYMNTVRRVAVSRGAYGLFNPPQCFSWQNDIDTFWTLGYSISGVDVEAGSSTWTWHNIYVQNLEGPVQTTVPVDRYDCSGTELNLSLRPGVVPAYVREGMFVILAEMADPRLNKYFVISRRTVTPDADVILLHTTEAVSSQAQGQGKLNFLQQEPVTGYPFTVSGDHDITGLDVEHAITRRSAFLNFGGGGAVNITHVHLEGLYSTAPTFRFLADDAPSLNIDTLEMMNLGFKSRSAVSVLGLGTGSMAEIGCLWMRDLFHAGSSWVLQRSVSQVKPVFVRQINELGTLRAGARPDLDNYGMGVVAPVSTGKTQAP